MIVDGWESLERVGGDPARGLALPGRGDAAVGPAGALTDDEADRFARAVWERCDPEAPALAVDPAHGGPLAAAGWAAVLVAGESRVSPYVALREATAAGAALPGPVACLTIGGGALRGQHGRRWRAVPGNLHLSVAMPCDLDAAACAPSLPMLAAVALCEAAERLLGTAGAGAAGPGIKWVNDVVLDGGKAGGVLTSLRTRGARVEAYFAGLGLNLAVAPDLPADPFALPAVALGGRAAAMGLGAAAATVLERLAARLGDIAANGTGGLVEAYRARSVVLGRQVEVWPDGLRDTLAADPGAVLPAPGRSGRVEAVLPDLSLRLAGQPEPVTGGCLRLAAGRGPGPGRR